MDLIDLAAEAGTVSIEVQESTDPVVTAKKFGSKRKLYPFTDKELEGYRMPGSDRKNLQIVCGIAEIRNDGQMTVTNHEQTASLLIPDNLEKLADTGIQVTAIVSDSECLDLKLGPFFGVVTWKLFYGNNMKSATSFSVR